MGLVRGLATPVVLVISRLLSRMDNCRDVEDDNVLVIRGGILGFSNHRHVFARLQCVRLLLDVIESKKQSLRKARMTRSRRL